MRFNFLTGSKAHRPPREEMIAYVQGYILALEDVLLEHDGLWSLSTAGIQTRVRVQGLLNSARATLATLEQMEDEATTSWKQFSGGLEEEVCPTTDPSTDAPS